jgi:hypothetical protein
MVRDENTVEELAIEFRTTGGHSVLLQQIAALSGIMHQTVLTASINAYTAYLNGIHTFSCLQFWAWASTAIQFR